MGDTRGHQTRIRSFILENFPVAKKRSTGNNEPLLESGIVDSLGILDVVAFLERTFSIKIEDDELVPENFGSIEYLASFVEKKTAQVGTPTA
jgi:acyl carrier protein